MIVVSKDTTKATCWCRRLPSGQSIYQFQFNARPRVCDSVPSIILTSDGVNLVVCAAKSSMRQNSAMLTSTDELLTAVATADNVLFTIRRVNSGDIIAKAKPNYPEYR